MKFREGFVSNSSSTSFCIIGTYRDNHVEHLFKAEGLDGIYVTPDDDADDAEEKEYFRGGVDGKVISFYGSDGPSYAGLCAEKLLEKMTIPEAKKHFQEVAEKLGVKIPLKDIRFLYGEVTD